MPTLLQRTALVLFALSANACSDSSTPSNPPTPSPPLDGSSAQTDAGPVVVQDAAANETPDASTAVPTPVLGECVAQFRGEVLSETFKETAVTPGTKAIIFDESVGKVLLQCTLLSKDRATRLMFFFNFQPVTGVGSFSQASAGVTAKSSYRKNDASQTQATGNHSIEITAKSSSEMSGTYRMPTSEGEAVVSFRLPWVRP